MRLFLQIVYYSIFALMLGLAALSIRSGENIIRSMVIAGHESSDRNKIGIFLDVVSNEVQAVFEQVYVNTVYTRLDSISGLTHISKTRLLEATGFTEGMELNAGQVDILKSKFSSYPWIRTYRIEKNFLPERMSVEIQEAKPAFIADYLGVSWVVSDEGVLLEPSSEIVESKLQLEIMKLPRILNLEPSGSDQDTYLSSFNERLNYVIRSYENIDLAGGFGFEVSSLSLIEGGGIKVETFDGSPSKSILVEIHSLEDARTMLARLESVTRDLQQRGEAYSELDFRFRDQVIKR
jgi:hypothetical protein